MRKLFNKFGNVINQEARNVDRYVALISGLHGVTQATLYLVGVPSLLADTARRRRSAYRRITRMAYALARLQLLVHIAEQYEQLHARIEPVREREQPLAIVGQVVDERRMNEFVAPDDFSSQFATRCAGAAR